MREKEIIFGTFNSWRYNENTYFITALNGSIYMYLIEGEDKALLIDTCYGFGRLREYVEKLTSKPIIVTNTHGHLDHCGGNGWWKEVYVHENSEIDMITLNNGEFDVNTLPYPNYKKIGINEGFVFDLGNRDIEVIDISAHSNGSLAFIDKTYRLLFTGDEIESGQVLMNMPNCEHKYDLKEQINKHLKHMEKIKDREHEFDFICPAHNGAPISKGYIDDFIELDKQILKDNQHITDTIKHFYLEQAPFAKKLIRAEYKNASYIYGE